MRGAESTRTMIRSESTESMMPSRRQITTAPESCAATAPCRCRRSGLSALEQRHGLALHVRSHQSAVRVIVLEERNQAGRDRDELLRTDVEILDLGAVS